MSKKNLCIISSLVIGISALLPYLSLTLLGASLSKSLLDGGDGYFVIAIAVVALFCSLKEKYIPAIIMGAASLGLFFLENNNVASNLKTGNSMSSAIARSMIQNSAGYYCLLAGSIALIVFGILAFREKHTEQ